LTALLLLLRTILFATVWAGTLCVLLPAAILFWGGASRALVWAGASRLLVWLLLCAVITLGFGWLGLLLSSY
jgi:hypothetical protein